MAAPHSGKLDNVVGQGEGKHEQLRPPSLQEKDERLVPAAVQTGSGSFVTDSYGHSRRQERFFSGIQRAVPVDTDRYGSTVARVWLDGRNIKAEMVRTGKCLDPPTVPAL